MYITISKYCGWWTAGCAFFIAVFLESNRIEAKSQFYTIAWWNGSAVMKMAPTNENPRHLTYIKVLVRKRSFIVSGRYYYAARSPQMKLRPKLFLLSHSKIMSNCTCSARDDTAILEIFPEFIYDMSAIFISNSIFAHIFKKKMHIWPLKLQFKFLSRYAVIWDKNCQANRFLLQKIHTSNKGKSIIMMKKNEILIAPTNVHGTGRDFPTRSGKFPKGQAGNLAIPSRDRERESASASRPIPRVGQEIPISRWEIPSRRPFPHWSLTNFNRVTIRHVIPFKLCLWHLCVFITFKRHAKMSKYDVQ